MTLQRSLFTFGIASAFTFLLAGTASAEPATMTATTVASVEPMLFPGRSDIDHRHYQIKSSGDWLINVQCGDGPYVGVLRSAADTFEHQDAAIIEACRRVDPVHR